MASIQRSFGTALKAPLIEENDVFSENAPMGKMGTGRAPALSDSSNSLKVKKQVLGRGLGKKEFPFKKPVPVKIRSASVPSTASLKDSTISTNDKDMIKKAQQIPRNDFNDYSDLDLEEYPEPEFLRDIVFQNQNESSFAVPTLESFAEEDRDVRLTIEQFQDALGLEEEANHLDSGEDDDQYPEIERFNVDFRKYVDYDNIGFKFESVSYEKDEPSISEPPQLNFQLNLDFLLKDDSLDYLSDSASVEEDSNLSR